MHVRWRVHTHGARGVHGWVGSIADLQGGSALHMHGVRSSACIHAWGDYIIRRSARMGVSRSSAEWGGRTLECEGSN